MNYWEFMFYMNECIQARIKYHQTFVIHCNEQKELCSAQNGTFVWYMSNWTNFDGIFPVLRLPPFPSPSSFHSKPLNVYNPSVTGLLSRFASFYYFIDSSQMHVVRIIGIFISFDIQLEMNQKKKREIQQIFWIPLQKLNILILCI